MPDHDDENHPLTSSKKFSSIRFRRLSISSKRRSELKAAISGPHVSYGAGTPTVSLGDAPLRVLNNTRLPHPSSAFVLTNGPSPPQSTLARSLRRNSDVPLGQHRSNLAWPTNHPEITPAYGPPHPPHRATHRKPHKADISRPLAPDSSRFSSAPVMSRKTSRRSAQIIRRPHLSGSIASGLFIGNTDEVAPQPLSLSDQQSPVSNLLGSPSDQFDPRTIVDSYPALDLDLDTGAASFGSVKQRTRKIDKALRTSRTVLLPAPRESVKPDLVYTDDSDALPSPPSTPSTPVWETATPPIPKLDPKLATQLDLADVHAQIQAMLDSVSRPPSTGSGDFEPANDYQTDVPPSPRPSNPMYRSLPRLATAHRRCASSPPLGSDIHNAYPPDFMGRLLYQPVAPVVRKNLISPTSPLPEVTPADQTSTPATPTKKSVSERSDSPSVYSQQSPSSQSDNITPTSSNASSPDHPHAKSKHERLLAAISEGISSPTKLGTTAPSVLGSGRRRDDKPDSALHTDVPTVPVIVVTDPNDDDLVYSESSFSIVDMYAGPVESVEARQRRRTRTANFVSRIGTRTSIAC